MLRSLHPYDCLMSLPTFCIVGAMKCGSTTLYEYLCRHPSVFMPPRKEPQFFSRDHIFAKGMSWYESLFAAAGPEQISGEASTCYSRWPVYAQAAERLSSALPHAKLVYLMRHPVDRLYSHYIHEMKDRFCRSGGRVTAFEQFVEDDLEGRCAGQYFTQIRHMLTYFPASQLWPILFEDLCDSPCAVLAQVQRFLGIEVIDLVGQGSIQANSTQSVVTSTIPNRFSRRLASRVRRAPGIGTFVDSLPVLPRRRLRRGFEGLMARSPWGQRAGIRFQRSLSPMTPVVRSRLCAMYADEVDGLADWLGRDLSHWKR